MNLLKSRILSSILIFGLCFLFHFMYEWIPSFITSIFFPVNESVWEHMKLLFSGICLYGIIDYFILKKFKIPFNNFFTSLLITSFISIPIYLAIFIPVYNKIGENMIFSIGLMLAVIIISQIISYFILKKDHDESINIISIFLIIAIYIMFGYLTYNPPHTNLFIDPISKTYGIKK